MTSLSSFILVSPSCFVLFRRLTLTASHTSNVIKHLGSVMTAASSSTLSFDSLAFVCMGSGPTTENGVELELEAEPQAELEAELEAEPELIVGSWGV